MRESGAGTWRDRRTLAQRRSRKSLCTKLGLEQASNLTIKKWAHAHVRNTHDSANATHPTRPGPGPGALACRPRPPRAQGRPRGVVPAVEPTMQASRLLLLLFSGLAPTTRLVYCITQTTIFSWRERHAGLLRVIHTTIAHHTTVFCKWSWHWISRIVVV